MKCKSITPNCLTDKDVAEFWKCVGEWCVKFRITDWRIIKGEGSRSDTECLADCVCTYNLRTAKITIYRDWGDEMPVNNKTLSEVAMHEVLHVVMAGLMGAANERFTTEQVLEDFEHDVIRAITSMQFKQGMVEN
jgi:hypothetical protein